MVPNTVKSCAEVQTLAGTTLGLIGRCDLRKMTHVDDLLGGGNIGLCLGRMYSQAFRANIILHDPYLTSAARKTWEDTVGKDRFTFADSLDDLLANSDVVSLHVPLTKSTRNLISAPQLEAMKPSSILINSARGGIVNEDDLAEALENGSIYGAGLDAFELEPPSLEKYERFCKLGNLVMT
jgi:phosphoglycerate dehydrogenase-like enzyme